MCLLGFQSASSRLGQINGNNLFFTYSCSSLVHPLFISCSSLVHPLFIPSSSPFWRVGRFFVQHLTPNAILPVCLLGFQPLSSRFVNHGLNLFLFISCSSLVHLLFISCSLPVHLLFFVCSSPFPLLFLSFSSSLFFSLSRQTHSFLLTGLPCFSTKKRCGLRSCSPHRKSFLGYILISVVPPPL